MISYSIKQLFEAGVISKKLKQVLSLLDCSSYNELVDLSNDKIKVDYIEKSYHIRDELFKTISDIREMEEILPELIESVKRVKTPSVTLVSPQNSRKFKVGDFTEKILKKSNTPISLDELLKEIRKYLPETYVASIRANLNGDPDKRFVFFLDGYVGLKGKEYDKRYQTYSISKKKVRYAELRIMEFLQFVEITHRSPQPHGLEEEESLYRWYLDFTKSSAKELAALRATFKDYLKEYDEWIFTPYEYSYKRNCDQVKWYVEKNLELPTSEDEPELFAWFNSQLENYTKHKDKRRHMFVDLMDFLTDYGMHFYDAKSIKYKSTKNNSKTGYKEKREDSVVEKYVSIFKSIKNRRNTADYAAQEALLALAVGNLIQNGILCKNEVVLDDDLLTEFADVCIDIVGTASSYNIAIPFYHMNEEAFWNIIPKEPDNFQFGKEHEITFDYIYDTIACAIFDNDLFELMSNSTDFGILRDFLISNIING